MSDKPMTKEDLDRVYREAAEDVAKLAALFPSCFDKNGRPIVAELRWPGAKATTSGGA